MENKEITDVSTSTLENNKLIADFMEHSIKDSNGIHKEVDYNYNTSWDWLMPVVEKCKERQIFGSQGLINNIDKRLLQVDLLATYGNVISFIEFYNIKKSI